MNVARRLENISVLDPDGRDVRLGDLWREQIVVLAFIRPGNRVDFSYISEEAGDHPSAEAIIAALDKIGRKQSGAKRR